MAWEYDGWPEYVSVEQRRQAAKREVERLRKKGCAVEPVVIEGKAIASTFWGKSWCSNLEHYSDYDTRVPRGRSYVRNGAVIDLRIEPGKVTALVSGSEIYELKIEIAPLPTKRWKAVCADCAGSIDSMVELLRGRFSKAVMERVCQKGRGLFPSPNEIEFNCSCPDWASMCKHVAAVLYGIGARLDEKPELLFRLRQVDEMELVAQAGTGQALAVAAPKTGRVLKSDDMADLFGLDLAEPTVEKKEKHTKATAKPQRARQEEAVTIDAQTRAMVAQEVRRALAPIRLLLDPIKALMGQPRVKDSRGHPREKIRSVSADR
ncbi:MAG: hypothetical protein LBM75_04545 [Myxococcales bacterium]|jgi:uncharacterized Zn finger protein|nr:hypothetical protein [Myxococcales bacterium]